MAELDHECLICGTKYHHCNGCKSMGTYLPWRATSCSPKCFQVLMAWKQYREAAISDEDMRQILLNHGFKGKQVRPELQEKFDELLADKPEEIMPVMETEPAQTAVEVVEENPRKRLFNHKSK